MTKQQQDMGLDLDGIGSYQQNVLFPQYAQSQMRVESQLGMFQGGAAAARHGHQSSKVPSGSYVNSSTNIQNNSKLRQVSQLMNEVVKTKTVTDVSVHGDGLGSGLQHHSFQDAKKNRQYQATQQNNPL